MSMHTIYYRAGQAALAIFAAAMIGGAVGVSCAIGVYVGALNITRFERAAKTHVQYVDEANRRDGAGGRYAVAPTSGTLADEATNGSDSLRSAREREKPLRLRSAGTAKTLKPEVKYDQTPLTFEQTQPPEIVEQLKEYVDRSESYMTEPESRFD